MQDAAAVEVHADVQTGLATERRQDRAGALFLQDFGHIAPGQRLDISPIRRARIGHDGGGIRVHEDDLVPLITQSLAGLRSGVVELTGLTDHNGTGADEENLLEVVTTWHGVLGAGGWREAQNCSNKTRERSASAF